MPWSVAAAAIGAAGSIYSAQSKSGSGGGGGGFSGGSSPPPAYIPQNQPGADAQYYNLASQFASGGAGLPGQVVPGLQTATQNLLNNPYGAQAQTGANAAGKYMTGTLAPNLSTASSSLFGLGSAGSSYGQKILQTGFDPQSALYNRTAQQVSDQTNAINAQYGLDSSAAGAGVAAQNASNFNIDWQHQQLQRQAQAAAGYGNLVQGAGQAYSGGADLGAASANATQTGSALPYNTYQAGQKNNIAALNALTTGTTNAYGLDANALNALSAYMKLGQSATSVGQAGAAQNFANNQALGKSLGSSLQSLSGLFGKNSNSTSAGNNYGANIYGSGGSNAYGASGALGTNPYGTSYGF